MKLMAIAVGVAALTLAGCGGSGGADHETTAAVSTHGSTTTATDSKVTGKLPPGSVGPVDTAEEAEEGPAATEASPGSPANGPASTGDLPDADRSAATTVVSRYIAALDGHDAARVCALIEPSGLPLSDLPKRRGGCRSSLRASMG